MRRSKKTWYDPGTQELALDLAPPHNRDEAMMRASRGLPENEHDLIAVARIALAEYDEAMKRGDHQAAARLNERIEAVGLKMNGGRMWNAEDEINHKDKLAKHLYVDDGSVPIWGQPGRFIVTFPDFRVLIDYSGILGVSEHGFSAYAVDDDRPFISETGFQSCYPREPNEPMTLEQHIKGYLEKSRLYDRFGSYGRGKIAPLVKMTRSRHRDEERANDPAWQPGGWIHEAAQKDKPPMPPKPKKRTAARAKVGRGARRRR